ncbi:MAG: hypothetical protein HQK76_09295 [Desulfobacterales bacterium]|nr:hypothetical protein [Desulfobacterales bacterium]
MSKKLLILFIFFLLIALAGAFVTIISFNKEKNDTAGLKKLNYKQELTDFIFKMLPDIYLRLKFIDEKLILIEEEIKKLDALEKNYPQQKQIIASQKNIWDKTKKSLTSLCEKIGISLEAMYVTYLIDKNKGIELINDQKDDLKTKINDEIESSKELLSKLKAETKQNFFDKLKSRK